jgi:Tol biopolymer transport system component
MGEVYRARDTRLDRTVAIKVLPAHLADAPGFRERFEREARAISAVEHPHICALYDIGSDGGVDFLVMQYVDGETLAERLARGPLPFVEAVAVARQVADALDAAHERGILHRDLKPSNIKLTSGAGVKILDFGLAKALDEPSAAAAVAADPGLSPTFTARGTAVGVVVGTAAYMSPEQARGKPVDKRTDIWAFGCVLFEMLTACRAFDGETVTDVLAAVIEREPPWSALPAATPPPLRALLQRCLAKTPQRRLRDIGDARFLLEDDEASRAGEASARPASRLPWAVAAVSLLVAAAALATLFWPGTRAPDRRRMHFSGVTNFSGVESQPSFSPDGRSVAFVSNRDGQWDIYVGLLSGGSLVRVTNDPLYEASPRWSPDGTRMLYSKLNDAGLYDVFVVPALGGVARRLVPNAFQPAWSRDGRSIAYSSMGSLWLADASGSHPRQVTRTEAYLSDHQGAFSHDGRSIAFVRRRGAWPFGAPYAALGIADVESGRVRFLTDDSSLVQSPVWSPDDRFIYFTSGRGGALNVWKVPASSGDPEQITAGQADDADIDLSADGTRLVFSNFRVNVNLAEVALDLERPGTFKWLTSDAARGENAPRYSPDGRRIAYFSNRGGAERESIWVMEADGSNVVRLVEDGRTNVFPRWSADGQAVFYLSRTASPSSVSTSLVAVGELRRVVVAGGAPEPLPVRPWSPPWGDIARDGRLIYRTSANEGEIVDLASGRRSPVRNLKGDPVWSPDGRSFAFAVRPADADTADDGVWLEQVGGSRRQVFRGWVVWIAWGPDFVAVLEGKPDLQGVLWRVDTDGRRTVLMEKFPLYLRHTDVTVPLRFDVHPDGRRVVTEGLESFEADLGLIQNVP